MRADAADRPARDNQRARPRSCRDGRSVIDSSGRDERMDQRRLLDGSGIVCKLQARVRGIFPWTRPPVGQRP